MRSPLLLCLLSFVDFAVTARLVGKTNSPPIAQVRNGTLAGYNVPAYGQDFFLGIPYAQAPVGQLRLANPQSLNGTFQGGKQDATEYYPSCVGYGTDDDGYPVSEDCLALNVIRPEGTEASERLPVAVWIHGGGDSEGGSRDERYNLSFIVQNSAEMGKPIIAASLNYRLAQWGFLAGDEIQEAGVANLGLKDQRLALHWIHENIGAFGGDPAKVTIWGESSGGGSVVYHSILYGGRDDHLYRGVISESYFANNNEANATAYNEWYAEVVTAAGCAAGPGSLECLRNAPFATLNTAFSATLGSSPGTGPVLDGDLLTELTSEALGCGRFVRAPILIGANFDEGTAFAVSGINTDEQFDATVAALGPDTGAVAEIAELYPDIPALGIPGTERGRPPANESSLGSQWKRSAAFFGDYVIHAPRRSISQAWTQFGVKSFSYHFNVRPNGLTDEEGVTHFQEVAFVFDNVHNYGYGEPISAKPFEGLGPKYYEIAELMDRMWVSFVHGLDPNHHGVPDTAPWPEYAARETRQNFRFDVNQTSEAEDDTYRAAGIAFINSVAASQFHR